MTESLIDQAYEILVYHNISSFNHLFDIYSGMSKARKRNVFTKLIPIATALKLQNTETAFALKIIKAVERYQNEEIQRLSRRGF